ncbi:type VII secretion target [Rhodococcus pyridinivorans]|uniref:type VII secretion target n=1 Tax=Rhodococcus pyridinivorans TaxID=103816 RepID=UPI002164CF18|nr:type VII secretion target [Rhodococcus pyridinivorans]UVT24651.1 type VII secretion target [Rhodococcus pyridinivorans]
MTENSGRDAIRIDTSAVGRFGDDAVELAARLHEAAERTRHGDPSALSAALGPIGAPVLAALTATHSAHVRDLGRLGDLLGGMGDAANASAAAYEHTTDDTAARLDSVVESL